MQDIITTHSLSGKFQSLERDKVWWLEDKRDKAAPRGSTFRSLEIHKYPPRVTAPPHLQKSGKSDFLLQFPFQATVSGSIYFSSINLHRGNHASFVGLRIASGTFLKYYVCLHPTFQSEKGTKPSKAKKGTKPSKVKKGAKANIVG